MDDKSILLIITIIPVALFFGLGIVFIRGKGANLIAGYNAMSPEEKKRFDTTALTKFIGKIMLGLAFCAALWAISAFYQIDWLLALGTLLFVGIVIFAVLFVNTSSKFKV